MRQGAVGHVRVVMRGGRALVEKRMADPARHDTELLALRALAQTSIPAPSVVDASLGRILMTLMPGERLDEVDADTRREGMRASAVLLRRLHETPVPQGLPAAPDDARILRSYRDAGGPPLPLSIPEASGPAAFCHGDWTDGNLLVVGGRVSGVVDWEAAHVGDPVRELARAAWAASRKDARCLDDMTAAYGADRDLVRAWAAVHAAELWLWFAEAGPPEHLAGLTAELRSWPL
ncbi:phosphotransferase [Microbacterium sp. JZ101]